MSEGAALYARSLALGVVVTPAAVLLGFLFGILFGAAITHINIWLIGAAFAAPGTTIALPVVSCLVPKNERAYWIMGWAGAAAGFITGASVLAWALIGIVREKPPDPLFAHELAGYLLIGVLMFVVPMTASGWLTALLHYRLTREPPFQFNLSRPQR